MLQETQIDTRAHTIILVIVICQDSVINANRPVDIDLASIVRPLLLTKTIIKQKPNESLLSDIWAVLALT